LIWTLIWEIYMTLEKFTPQIPTIETKDNHWHAMAANEVLRRLDSMAEQGLSDEEAARRLEIYGPNQLVEKPPATFWKMLWDQFNNFLVILLIVASVISAILGDYIEAAAIMAIVILNATLGVIQERSAAQALAALRSHSGSGLLCTRRCAFAGGGELAH
jgi:Ca2+-transporting ATPase